MDDKVLQFAQDIGYSTIKKLGEYDNKTVYKPKGSKSKFTGYPKYIIVENENIELIIDSDLEISLHFYKED